MSRSTTIVAPKPMQCEQIEREEKEISALIRATDRALSRYAKRTGTVFIGRDGKTVEIKNKKP